jgi:mono/diheme cytochrome c family protein
LYRLPWQRRRVVSGIDLGHGKFRHVSTDEEIVSVIVSGVPGTGMPASKISRPRAFTIVAYIRTMSDAPERKSIAAKSGSAVRGKALFENQAGCSSCHRIRGQGGRSEAATGEKKWQLDFVDVTDAGILTTASDLLFTGNREEHFSRSTPAPGQCCGRPLWEAQFPTGQSLTPSMASSL